MGQDTFMTLVIPKESKTVPQEEPQRESPESPRFEKY